MTDAHRLWLNLIALVALVMLGASAAEAQGPTPGVPDPDRVRVRIGPLWMNPTLSLTNAGIDTNVFNESDDQNPKRDLTLTVTPQTQAWLGMGRTWVTGVVKEDLVWFKKYSNQRTANHSYTVGWLIPLTRISFDVSGSWLTTHERPGFEIDARAGRKEHAFTGSVEIRGLSQTLFGVRGEQRNVDFADDATFLGESLNQELNRTSTSAAFTVRHELTPLTSVTIDAGRRLDRFESASRRDSDSTFVNVGLQFDPFALVSGRAQFGVRDFTPLSSDVPAFRGATAAVNLTYVALGSTRLGVQITRDVQYSFDINQPYYLQTGTQLSLGQQIYGPVDMEGRVSLQRLAYRDREGAAIEAPERVDHSRIYGFGFGYRMGQDVRVAFNVDKNNRDSALERRRYHGLKYGTAITYGF